MEKWPLGTTAKELKKFGLRQDFIFLLESVVQYRNYIAHELLVNDAIIKAAVGKSGRLERRHLEKGIFELEQLMVFHDPRRDAHAEGRVGILKGGAETLLSKQPGYVSAAIHQGKDGKHAVVYSQWRSQKDFQAVRNNPALQQYFARVREIATFAPISYEVTYVHHV
jgi:heme-degrading monooxygenase HmoA